MTFLLPDLAPKIFLGALGLNTLNGILVPEFHLKMYGPKSVDAFSAHRIQAICSCGLGVVTMFYLQLYKGMSFEEAMGWSVIPSFLNCAYRILFQKDKGAGIPLENSIASVAVLLTVFLASRIGGSVSSGVIKGFGGLTATNSALFYFAPQEAAEVFFFVHKTPLNVFVTEMFGTYMILQCASICFQAFLGMPADAALGWTIACVSVALVAQGLRGRLDPAGVYVIPIYIWGALQAWCAASLLCN